VSASIDTARDAAQQMVTACLHGDRDTAASIAQDYPEPLILALVLADLTAYTHTRWCQALGTPEMRAEGWQALMADVEEWRAGRP
jgi:hypothetical protein